ncbi:MAG: ArsR family transcriptional regulator [Verrucomicrobia bacterium]|nr:MAG: ArsR family transcriptional regulator [Verrucomicrobiota bacterium]
MKRDDAVARAKILKALANPTRLMMVDELSRGDRCVSDLRFLARVDPSVISRHLAQLKTAGIVIERRAGMRVIHHLECPCILQALDCTLGVMQSDAVRKSRLATVATRKA